MLLSNISPQTLQKLTGQLVVALCKIDAPYGVRLSLIAMQRSLSPKKYMELLKVEPAEIRENVLQLIIAAARVFPSSDIDVVKGTQLATESMRDNRRSVRQAALETLATLAQVAGNTVVLNTVTWTSKYYCDAEYLLRVVRTR